MIPQGWLCAATFALGLLLASMAQEWRWEAKYEAYAAGVANDAKDRALAVLLALEAAGEQVKAGEARISKQREDNAKANVELDRLNHCLKSGTCGLRVAARCPQVPNTAAGDGAIGDTTTGARLDALAGWRYLDFKRGYAEQLKVLRLCKAYGETQSKKPSQ